MVELPDDIFEYLQTVRGFGETEWAALRRILKLSPPNGQHAPAAQPAPSNAVGDRTAGNAVSALQSFLADPSFRLQTTVTGGYLGLLGWACRQDPRGFEGILDVPDLAGSRRKYLGRSKKEIESSGKSTHPRQIGGTEYWALTNADTEQKCEILRRAFKTLGYSDEDINLVIGALARMSRRR